MKLSVQFLTLTVALTALTLSQAAEPLFLEESCLDLEDLGLRLYPNVLSLELDCTGLNIKNFIKEKLLDFATCPHGAKHEAVLLTDSSNWREAKFTLRKMCKGEPYEPCTTWDDAFLKSCDFLDIMSQIKEKVADLGESCSHDAVEELKILTHANTRKKAKLYIKEDLCLSSVTPTDSPAPTTAAPTFAPTFACEICSKYKKVFPAFLDIQYVSNGVNSLYQDSGKASCREGQYPSSNRLTVTNMDGDTHFDVVEGTVFKVLGPFDASTKFSFSDGFNDCYFHTSCSVPLVAGDQIGPFKLLAGNECNVVVNTGNTGEIGGE